MKNKLFIITTVLFLSFGVAQSASAEVSYDDMKKWNISSNPFSYFLGSANAGAAYAFHKHVAARVSLAYNHYYFIDPTPKGFGVAVGVPVFFEHAFKSFYLEPGAAFTFLTQSGDSINLGGPQLMAGYQWLWNSGFNIDFGLGLGYMWASAKFADSKNTGVIEGVIPVGRLSFGFAF